MRLLLIRHGETDWNSEQRIQGRTDVPLNARGMEQAEKLAARLASEERMDVIYTSPLIRAGVTAERIASRLGLAPIQDDRLAEQEFGAFEGLCLTEIGERYPEFLKKWRTDKLLPPIPGAETISEFQERVQEFMQEIQGRHPGAPIGIVTHGGTLRILLATLLDLDIGQRLPFTFDNASVSKIDVGASRVDVRLLNDTCHLIERQARDIA